MARKGVRGESLYLAWKLDSVDPVFADTVRERLHRGARDHLYRLYSWVIVNGEVRALIVPEAPLEQIARAICDRGTRPSWKRWVAGLQARAAVSREIETVPVSLGLAPRPEQWPLSSAATA